jgi:hypothetical protein
MATDKRVHILFERAIKPLRLSLEKTTERLEVAQDYLKEMEPTVSGKLTQEEIDSCCDAIADPDWPNVIE